MAYKIQYNINNSMRIKRRPFKKISGKRILLLFVLLILTLTALFTDVHRYLIDFLIPGDNAVTLKAVHVFSEEVRAGQSFYDALVTFCRVVLFGAKG